MPAFLPMLLPLPGLLAGLVLLAACQSPQSKTPAAMATPAASHADKFRLSAVPGAADGYTATIDEGRFITPGGGSFPVPWGHTLEGNWGGSAIGWVVGDELQPAPDSLEIRWFSYAEDKFYEGHFLMPQQRIHALLKQGYWDAHTNKQDTYSTLAVCVVPKGAVVVWLRGDANTVLIGRYQAAEVAYSYARHRPQVDRADDVRETRAAMPAHVRQEIAAGTVSGKRWDSYLKTYPWQLAFSQPVTLTNYSINYLSAEVTSAPLTPDMAAYAQGLLRPLPKAVPKEADLYVTGAYGRKRLLRIEPFAEAETMAAFQRLHQAHPQAPLTLHLELDERLTKATLALQAAGQSIPLLKTQVQVFSAD
jgi:hypothetical protein